ncbi:hypothetical protein DAPPUDRAFT_249337 [Daphnia pulex]|uniref:Uncharacterized protein n=1 Tax=Daphnia pulex TaxID=6669 RepID=E9GWG2_DAPPU|nr:hypothetical protein DAPPUDRAFT_249337 [Daphnia pulex]|eukprot:EFX76192.1 hypothetical protein DAPPUDRAFT_249337 [Daphnia pulex]
MKCKAVRGLNEVAVSCEHHDKDEVEKLIQRGYMTRELFFVLNTPSQHHNKKDANQMTFFMLAQALYQKGVVEHYSYYLEQAEIKRIRNPRIPGRAPSVAASATLETTKRET